MKKIYAISILICSFIWSFGQTEIEKGLNAINEDVIKSQLEFLASDWTEGRAVGTKGAYMAADYIASMFKLYGVKPFGDETYTRPSRKERMAGIRPEKYTSYYQNFSLIEYEPGEEQTFSLINGKSALDFGYETDFSVRTGTIGQTAEAPLVFVGYGFTNKEKGYDDLQKMDLNGKIAVLLNGFPGHEDTASVAYKKFIREGRYAQYYMERDKIENLEKAGVVAIIKIYPGSDPTLSWAQNRIYPVKGSHYEADTPLKSYYDKRMSLPDETLSSSIPTFTVTQRVANEIIKGSGINFDKFEENAKQTMKPASKTLEGKSVAFKTSVKSKIVKARNVVGIIEGEKKDEFIVVGGHYDHLGKWDGFIWNGADDNASGTVGVMTLAKAFKATGKKPEKSVIFATWTGEEKGLFGSRYFVREALEKEMNIVLNLNYDMIARDTEKDSLKNKAGMTYTKANYKIEESAKKYIDEYDINLDINYHASEKPGGGSDHAPFADKDIPVFYFMAAMHPDYHQPSDELSKINWEKMMNIIKIGFLNTWEFANSDDWKETKTE